MEPEVVYSDGTEKIYQDDERTVWFTPKASCWRVAFVDDDGDCVEVFPRTAEIVAIVKAVAEYEPTLLRSMLSPEQVEAIEWAIMVAKDRATRKLEEGVVNHAEVLDGRVAALRSLLGEEVDHER